MTEVGAEMWRVLNDAERLFDRETIDRAVDQLAVRVSVQLYERNPLLMCVMKGGVSLTGDLLRRLHFPLELDFLHATRYADTTHGGELIWRVEPSAECRGRDVLVVDDILDGGTTLAAVRDRLHDLGARNVLTAVLVRKRLARTRPIDADFVAVECPDRYIFGRGMDYQGYWRNLAEIYAVKESK